jgi:hypothetical protein
MTTQDDHDPAGAEPDRKAGKVAARQVEANDWKWLMSSKQGRRCVWRLLEKAGVYRTSFTGNSETFFREGMRNMGLFVVDAVHTHAPDAYALMVAESKAKE